uniref:Uncharacterized protein n=1 Tax=Accipiter nisus TaxID=211598 RepID=A0A8B9MH17_9AVES
QRSLAVPPRPRQHGGAGEVWGGAGPSGKGGALRKGRGSGVTDTSTPQEEEEEEEGQAGAKAPGLGGGRRYVPPRLVPVQYGESRDPESPRFRAPPCPAPFSPPFFPPRPADAVGEERERRAREAARRRALSSSVIRELREELSEAPQELGGAGGAFAPPRASRLRTQYEEAMLVRLSETKRERAKRRQAAAAGGGLAAITHFGDIGALLETTNQVSPTAPPPG